MSEQRLTFLLACLRFDDRTKRNRADKFSPISGLPFKVYITKSLINIG